MSLSFRPAGIALPLPDNFLPVALPHVQAGGSGLRLPVIDIASGAVAAVLDTGALLDAAALTLLPAGPDGSRQHLMFGPPARDCVTCAATPLSAPARAAGAESMVGIIDIGIAFWNPCFAPGGMPQFRSVSFLHLAGPAGPGEPATRRTVLGAAEIAALCATARAPGGERRVRAELAARFPQSLHAGPDRWGAQLGHGTAMADLAGRGGAPLFGLELPRAVLEDSTGGTLEAMIVPAIRELVARMQADPAAGRDTRMVVLLAFAWTGGPQDGTRPGARVLSELMASPAMQGVSLVLPMGNHRASACHARAVMPQALGWALPPDDHSLNTVELFHDAPAARLRLTDPAGTTAEWALPAGPALALLQQDGRTVGMGWQSEPEPGGRRRLRLTLAGTASAGPVRPVARAGTWRVALTDDAPAPSARRVEAWILRDDLHGSDRRRAPFRQSRFVALPLAEGGGGTIPEAGTGSALATAGGASVQRVAALERPGPGQPARPARYSGQPMDPALPVVSVLVDDPRPDAGVPALGNGGARRFRVSGTSVAAALHAGRIAGTGIR